MINHAIVFGPVGVAVFWDEKGCHVARVNDEGEMVNCDSYLPFLLEGTIEAQRLKDDLDPSELQSSLTYWFKNHQALRAILGTFDSSLTSETVRACMSTAETLINDDSTLHFVACRLLGCRPSEELASKQAERLSQDPNYPRFGWLVGLLQKNRNTIDVIASFAKEVLSNTITGDVEKLEREIVDSGFVARHVAQTTSDKFLTNLLEWHQFDRRTSGNIVPYEHPLLTSRWAWPYRVGHQSAVEVELRPRGEVDASKLRTSLPQLLARDGGLRARTIQEGAIFLGGQSEEQLKRATKVLEKEYGVDLVAGDPGVAFREQAIKSRVADHWHKLYTPTHGEYSFVKLIVEPFDSDGRNVLDFALATPLPKELIRGIEKGVESVFNSGMRSPLINTKVTVIDANYHDIDSTEATFEIAGREACRDALQSNTQPMEPTVKVWIMAPKEHSDRVLESLKERASDVLTKEFGVSIEIEAKASMNAMMGYSQVLQEIVGPAPSFSTEFDHYQPVQAKAQEATGFASA